MRSGARTARNHGISDGETAAKGRGRTKEPRTTNHLAGAHKARMRPRAILKRLHATMRPCNVIERLHAAASTWLCALTFALCSGPNLHRALPFLARCGVQHILVFLQVSIKPAARRPSAAAAAAPSVRWCCAELATPPPLQLDEASTTRPPLHTGCRHANARPL